jgi:outer membrane protein assembly factor BamB
MSQPKGNYPMNRLSSLLIISAILALTLVEPALHLPFHQGDLAAQASAPAAPLLQTPEPTKVFLPMVATSTVIDDGGGGGGGGGGGTGGGSDAEWPMVAANPQRTSWTSEEAYGQFSVEWYRPIEAYIPQHVQVIAANDLLYISTAGGLYALHADTGQTAWRFDTEMPLGNSPTIADDVAYVGGFDRKLHALNALTGQHLWSFDGAGAGYDANPLVVDGRVIVGNRDGYLYAIGAQGTAQQGDLLWKFKTGGPIHYSAAYQNGVVYFAANDNYAYAVRADNGTQVWKSAKLPGDGYQAFWPVIYRDKVVFSASVSYRMGLDPGTTTFTDDDGTPFGHYRYMETHDLFQEAPYGTLIGPTIGTQNWSHGYPVVDASRVTEYLENNPDGDPYDHKPWRKTFVVLNAANGNEYTFDSDHDGYPETMPIAIWGTNSGNRYPPVVGMDDIIYQNGLYIYTGDSQGMVMGWNLGTNLVSIIGGQAAIAEPQAISAGGNLIYRSLCCDRIATYFDTRAGNIPAGTLWSYNLSELAPGYDAMWTILPGWPRLQGWYKGNSDSINGIYHNHGDQNPIIPYKGRLYVHRSNAIVAFGPGTQRGVVPLLTIQPPAHPADTLTEAEMIARLEAEVQKIVNTGHMRPGYYNNGQFTLYRELANYFENPGDTLYTLSIAYPYLSPALQTQTKAFLQKEFQDYFDPVMYSTIGWADGAPRDSTLIPPDLEAALDSQAKREYATNWSWPYPQYNFYGMWKYAQIAPENAARIYTLAKSKLVVPVPSLPVPDYFQQRPYDLNGWISGYLGFLELQDFAGMAGTDAQLRSQVTTELNRLIQLRANIFDKDTYFADSYYHKRPLNIARNFIMMVPELGDHLRQLILAEVEEAVAEYDYVAPYWFVSRYEAAVNEGARSTLYNYPALFQAKAFILKSPQAELSKYLDVPAFEQGDLFYLQNLVAAIEAAP